MATQSDLPLSKKRKLSSTASNSATVAPDSSGVQPGGHVRVAFAGPEHDAARKVVAEGEEVLNSQNHQYETFKFEGSTYVLTGPNQQVLVVYDPEHPNEFWNEVTDKNFITAHLQHHPMKMEVFVQDMRKTYVPLARDEARQVLKKVLGAKRIPYAAASKVGNRDVRGPWVYAMVPPVLFNDYVAKQRRNARKVSGAPTTPNSGIKEEVEDERVVHPRAPVSLAQTVVPRSKPGAKSNARASAKPVPMETAGDKGKTTPQVSPSKYKPLVLSPVRPPPSRPRGTTPAVAATATATNSTSSNANNSAPAALLSESQTVSIDRINNTHKSLMQLCDKMAEMLITQRGTDEYLQQAVAEYHAMWSGCTTYVQLKANMTTRKTEFEKKNAGKDYPLMDDLVWLHIFTNPDLVRKLRNRVAENRTVKLDIPLSSAAQTPQPMAT